ncbi:hypothetical protein [Liquorilactobacillus hordei]|uniref:hypothetical protein n=1 Tax=Liquorilactobacillus hordei TaxID=468911 RepID=UPI0039EC2A76
MNREEFDKKYNDFQKQFDESFDTPENHEALRKIVLQIAEKEEDVPVYYEHVYMQQRMNNLVKNALLSFLDFDEKS